jgi:hypothetical protein
LVVGAMLSYQWFGKSPELGTTPVARFSVVRASDALVRTGAVITTLAEGQGLGEGVTVIAKDDAVVLDCSDANEGRQPAAQVTLRSGGEVRLQGGSPLLVDGTLELRTERPMLVQLIDGSRVELGSGVYHLDVLAQRSIDAPLRGVDTDYAVRVEVLDGEDARLVRDARAGGGTFAIGTNMVGRYSGYAAVTIDSMPRPSSMGNQATPAGRETTPLPMTTPDFVGFVARTARGEAPRSARVQIDYLGSAGQQTASVLTDESGRFELAAGSGIKGKWLVLQAQPPAGRMDLGLSLPQIYPLQRSNDNYTTNRSIELAGEWVVRGSVTDVLGESLAGVRMVPCLYDSAFGTLQPWPSLMVATDSAGQFQLRGLPMTWPLHQTLGVCVLGDMHEAQFVPLPTTVGAPGADLRVQLTALQPIELRGLPPGASVELLESLAELPRGCAARRYVVQADARGNAPGLRRGRGQLWLRTGSEAQPALRLLVPEGGAGIYVPGSEPEREFGSEFRPLGGIVSTPFLLSSSNRYLRCRGALSTSPELIVVDRATGRAVNNVELYAVRMGQGGEDIRLLGVQDANSVPIELESADQMLVALGADGALARVPTNSVLMGRRLLPLLLAAAGTVEVDAPLRPATGPLAMAFEPRVAAGAAPLPTIYRFADVASGWAVRGLPAGDYTVRLGSRLLSVNVPAGGRVTLR